MRYGLKGEKMITIEASILHRGVKATDAIRSKDNFRPILQAIHSEIVDGDNGQKLRLVSTDSYSMAIVDLPLLAITDEGTDSFLLGSNFKEIVALANSVAKETTKLGSPTSDPDNLHGVITIETHANMRVRIFTGWVGARMVGSVMCQEADGSFPNYRELIPEWTYPSESFALTARRLAVAGNVASLFCGGSKDTCPVSIQWSEKHRPILFKAGSEIYGHCTVLVMPVKVN
jgi:DNA polymerase III sliding clamp (beta) subunit (PCNA family)